MQMSFRERFFGLKNPVNGGTYAPSTLGAPVFITQVDYSVFKQTKEQKMEAAIQKASLKKELFAKYGKSKGIKMKTYAKISS